MRVVVGDRTYFATFKNISELREHPALPEAVLALLEEKSTNGHEKTHLGLIASLKPFIRLKPRRASIITTRCTIALRIEPTGTDLRPPLAVLGEGEAFYARAEILAGVPFNRTKAWRLSLADALSNTFPSDHLIRKDFWHAFEVFLDKRALQVTRTAEASRPPAGGSLAGSPQDRLRDVSER